MITQKPGRIRVNMRWAERVVVDMDRNEQWQWILITDNNMSVCSCLYLCWIQEIIKLFIFNVCFVCDYIIQKMCAKNVLPNVALFFMCQVFLPEGCSCSQYDVEDFHK